MSPSLARLTVADAQDAWRAAGFEVGDGGRCRLGSVEVVLAPEEGKKGVRSWALREVSVPTDGRLEGLRTSDQRDVDDDVCGQAVRVGVHPNGTTSIDHVVVMTPDIERTIAAFEAAGLALRRRREGEAYGSVMLQAFFRLGEVVLEVVGSPEPTGDGPARFFGLAVTVADLDATSALLGEHLGAAKEAVQPGRRIATLRSSAGVGTPVAFMSPEPDGEGGAPA